MASYKRWDGDFFYLRTKNDVEIDFIIQKPKGLSFIKIKSKQKVQKEDAKALETIGKDLDAKADKWLLSKDPLEREFGSTRALHWQTAIKELFK